MLDWTVFAHLREELGTAFYIASQANFNRNYNLLLGEFKKWYPNTNIAYSYKTNYLPQFCLNVNSMGGYAEVVSSMELQLALKLGVQPNKIFFNGPFKEEQPTLDLLMNGGTVNIDSLEEFERIALLLEGSDRCVSIGVRCNFNINDGVKSRFGITENDRNLISLIDLVVKHQNMQFIGLHCHFASRNLNSWKMRTAKMISFISELPNNYREKIKYVSLGGGLYSDMNDALKSQLSQYIPSFSEYAQVSAKEFSKLTSRLEMNDVKLIIEPGTAVVADALYFAASVQSVKMVDEQAFITLNGSAFNIGTFKSGINLPVTILRDPELNVRKEVNDAKIVGYTCIEGDVLYTGFSGAVCPGDVFLFEEAGSYSIVMKPPFILPNVPIVEITDNGKQFNLLKRQETFDDMFGTYEI